MGKKKKHINISLKKYLKYFKNSLSNEEKNAFEKKVMQDLFDEEAYEGLSSISPNELKNDLKDLDIIIKSKTLNKKNKRNLPLIYMRYAAIFGLLIGIGTIIYFLFQTAEKSNQIADTITKEQDSAILVEHKTKKTEKYLEEKIIPEVTSHKAEVNKYTSTEQKLAATKKEITEISSLDEITETGYNKIEKPEIVEIKTYSDDEEISTITVEKTIQDKAKGVAIEKSKKSISSEMMFSVTATNEIKTSSPDHSPTVISGRVINEFDNEPLPGVNVIIKGTTLGTVTDMNGNFSIEVPPDKNQVLSFNYIGYTPEEVEIFDNQEINVTLKEDILALDEVVVVGFGTAKKTDVTGSISRIEMDEKDNEYSFIPPSPVNGMKSYKDYIKENIRYNELPSIEKNITVKVKFIVEVSGSLSNINVIKSQGEIFDNEAIRLIQEGQPWKPALENNKPIAKKVSLKIKFEAY